MSTELKPKFIQYCKYNDREHGFTLVELLVVIIIIGILSAIALPNFLNQSAKAKQSEAKQNIGSIRRAQNIYRTQNNQFASTFDRLAIGTLNGNSGFVATSNYSYTLTASTDSAIVLAQAQDAALKGYSGANHRYDNNQSISVIASILCEAVTPGTNTPTTPGTSTIAAPTCTAPYIKLD